jgi:hypothetical protein
MGSPLKSSKVAKNRVSRHKPYDVPRYMIPRDFTKKMGRLRDSPLNSSKVSKNRVSRHKPTRCA